MKDFLEDAWNGLKEYWFILVFFLLFAGFIGGLTYAQGTAHQIILDRHGYYMNWFQAAMVDVEELAGDRDFDVNLRTKLAK